MAILEKLQGIFKLREAWPRIERNDEAINAEIVGHKASKQAHKAEDIIYSGNVSGTSNVKQAIDATNQRISDIVAQSGDDITEIVDARDGYTTLGDRLGAADDRLNNKIIVTEDPPATSNRLAGSFYFHITDSIPIPTDTENLRVSPNMGIKVKE